MERGCLKDSAAQNPWLVFAFLKFLLRAGARSVKYWLLKLLDWPTEQSCLQGLCEASRAWRNVICSTSYYCLVPPNWSDLVSELLKRMLPLATSNTESLRSAILPDHAGGPCT